MRRTIVFFCVIVVLTAGCAEQQLGRKVPECDLSLVNSSTTVILMAQSVPGTDYLPCVVALLPGWDFEDVRARSDQSFFTLDSDRMGDDFLRVTLLPSCEVGAATIANTDESGTELSIEVLEERDVKGLYAKARAGIIKGFTGISDPYEAPEDADLAIDTEGVTPEECAQQVILHLEKEGYIGA